MKRTNEIITEHLIKGKDNYYYIKPNINKKWYDETEIIKIMIKVYENKDSKTIEKLIEDFRYDRLLK